MSKEKTSKTSVALAWMIVGIPLIWGITQTIQKSLALFF